jgi:hypothetical protein
MSTDILAYPLIISLTDEKKEVLVHGYFKET